MKKLSKGSVALLAFLSLAGGVLSQKGPPQVVISQVIANNSRLMDLEWKSTPGIRYAVETSDRLGGWITIAPDVQDTTGTGNIRFPIPDEYLFDSKRFFRVRTNLKR